ncbi:NrsF family protein [Ancylobacter sp. MQZ15Z-1]|uniref:NrsF family protein n=1 Tax=Ancylobacter mangrovi TaxID=2972472 RepID=A0A9X2PIG8_9HYPH|nr:NrsF family protein [Ancylobacter mangrovi]MCS0496803.1 NrsF family protein [Ancylobacter mangrovi]
MKTTDLISLMAADAPVRMRLGRALALALVAGVVVSAVVLLVSVGLRHNLVSVFETARVLFKVCFTLALAVSAAALVFRVGRPGAPLGRRLLLLAGLVAVLLAAIGTELMVVPPAHWMASLEGANAAFCVFFIPVLSLAPLGALLYALREGAPDSPGLAGAAAGLAASAIGAALYAWHCPDDSPLFVATWYMLGIAIVTTAGFFAGRRLLRW